MEILCRRCFVFPIRPPCAGFFYVFIIGHATITILLNINKTSDGIQLFRVHEAGPSLAAGKNVQDQRAEISPYVGKKQLTANSKSRIISSLCY
jgi:hypothetical protein